MGSVVWLMRGMVGSVENSLNTDCQCIICRWWENIEKMLKKLQGGDCKSGFFFLILQQIRKRKHYNP